MAAGRRAKVRGPRQALRVQQCQRNNKSTRHRGQHYLSGFCLSAAECPPLELAASKHSTRIKLLGGTLKHITTLSLLFPALLFALPLSLPLALCPSLLPSLHPFLSSFLLSLPSTLYILSILFHFFLTLHLFPSLPIILSALPPYNPLFYPFPFFTLPLFLPPFHNRPNAQ